MPTTEAAPISDTAFDTAFAAGELAGDGSPVVLAVSGGPDSTALMHAAAAWSRRGGGPRLRVATVDHGLRPEARSEALAVGAAAAALGLPHAILAWTDRPPGPISQEAAREARYALLVDHARSEGATRLATAHTLDDQAETILMRLADGSGLSGLAGMAPATWRDGIRHLRPLLGFRKAALVATCRARGWSFVEDPTNRDPRFARPRWRTLSATLEGEGLTAGRIARLGSRMRRADDALDAIAGRVAADLLVETEGAGIGLDFTALCREPDEIGLRVLVRALRRARSGSTPLRLERVEAAFGALVAAREGGGALRSTLAGCILSLDRQGRLAIRAEGMRRRGR